MFADPASPASGVRPRVTPCASDASRVRVVTGVRTVADCGRVARDLVCRRSALAPHVTTGASRAQRGGRRMAVPIATTRAAAARLRARRRRESAVEWAALAAAPCGTHCCPPTQAAQRPDRTAAAGGPRRGAGHSSAAQPRAPYAHAGRATAELAPESGSGSASGSGGGAGLG